MEALVLYLVHGAAALIWVGGLFFAAVILEPAARTVRDPAERNALRAAAFSRFFLWVWVSLVLLFLTGFRMAILSFGGMADLPDYVNYMMLLGVVMAILFVIAYFGPYHTFRKATDSGDPTAAKAPLARLRAVQLVSFVLGLIAFVLGVAGKFIH